VLQVTSLKSCPVLCAALQAATILIIALGSRLPQIVLNVRRGNSGELSTTTSALNLAGNLARIMTTLVLTQVCWPVLAGLPPFQIRSCNLAKPFLRTPAAIGSSSCMWAAEQQCLCMRRT
jgi:hypothetical protein